MIKRIFNSKTRLGIAIIVILMLVMGLSYGTFLITTDNYKVSELLIAELNYGIKIEEDSGQACTVSETKVTTPANSECFITIEISSVNPIDSRYALAYKNETGTAIVQYTDKTQWKSEGVIEDYNSNYTRKVRVVINNNGNSRQAVTNFKVFGGYKFNSEVSIDLKDGYQTIPGTYTESIEAGNQRLVDIVEKDTDCVTSTSKECLYGGETITNYLQYPTPADGNTNDNLWRITGSYSIDGTTYSKVVYNDNYVANTSKDNIQTTLINFYNTLDKASETIQNTNKFNCTKEGCTISAYDKIGLLSTYEYDAIGGQESYLGISDSWFVLGENGVVKNITTKGIEEASGESGVRPTAYLQTDVTVTGKGTIDDPYRISPKGDINLVAYTLDGKPTTEKYETLIKNYIVNEVTCKNGSKASWDYSKNAAIIENVNLPEYCTIDFIKEAPFMLKLKIDNPVRNLRSDFSKEFIASGLYVENDGNFLEPEGKEPTINEVYYFVGNPDNNWVQFANYWWRIIRTNEDGSVRLLYAGTSPEVTDAYIAQNSYNGKNTDDTMYVGFKYGTKGSQETNRENTYNSNILGEDNSVDTNTLNGWYNINIKNKEFNKYISKTAIYCNDRTSTNGYKSTGEMYYNEHIKFSNTSIQHPSFKCGVNGQGIENVDASIKDKFSGVNENAKLINPIGLITADEIIYAGGTYSYKSLNKEVYYKLNSVKQNSVGEKEWWTMTPDYNYCSGTCPRVAIVVGDSLYYSGTATPDSVIRPVLSIKACAIVTGNGTTTDPYIPSIDAACAAADN